MLVGFFDVAVDPKITNKNIYSKLTAAKEAGRGDRDKRSYNVAHRRS